jgi:hypothetical protein
MKREEGRGKKETLKNNKAAANSSLFTLHTSLIFCTFARNKFLKEY